MSSKSTAEDLPDAHLAAGKMAGHWLLARLGKRVLRPGGLELTRAMLGMLAIQHTDRVVEFAPGLGTTTRITLAHRPAAYTGIERDEAAAAQVRRLFTNESYRCLVGEAEASGLEAGSASVVYGEAMLTMQSVTQKERIVREAYRLLAPGGRYGIHELSLVPDSLAADQKQTIQRDLAKVIQVNARPLTVLEWRALLESAGFQVERTAAAPMHLLEPRRMIQDEGMTRALRIGFNILRDRAARERILAMRATFRKYRSQISAVSLVAVKPGA